MSGGMFGSFATSLKPQQEAAFQAWRAKLPPNLQGDQDYDLRGAFVANAHAAANGHLTDRFKKPNHMTFSDGSIYSTPQTPGGHWSGQDGQDAGWVFWGSPTNLRYHSIPELAQYFAQYEPGNTFVAPLDYRLPPQ